MGFLRCIIRGMKRSAALCLALCLVLCSAALAEDTYTQMEKMYQQIDLGSGLRGVMKFSVTGDTGWADALRPLDDTEIQMRWIAVQGKSEGQAYAVRNEERTGMTSLYSDGEKIYLKSDLLMGLSFELPLSGDLLSSITSAEGHGNPTLYSAILKILMGDAAARRTAFLSVRQGISTFLESYVKEPELTKAGTQNRMIFRYALEPEDVRLAIKEWIRLTLASEEATEYLRSQMTEEQAQMYLSSQMEWYYDRMIDQIEISDTVSMTRTVTMQGEEISAEYIFPLSDPKGAWTGLQILSRGDDTTYVLIGQAMTVQFQLSTYVEGASPKLAGSFQLIPAEGEATAVAFTLEGRESTRTDEEDYTHQVWDWSFSFEPDRDAFPSVEGAQAEDADGEDQDASFDIAEFDPVRGMVRFHFYSKPAKRAATTLEVTLDSQIPGGQLQGAARFMTATPWEMTGLDGTGARSMAQMSQEDRWEVLQDVVMNLMVTLDSMRHDIPLDEPGETTATPSDLADAVSATPTDLQEAAEPENEEVPVDAAEAAEDAADAEEPARETEEPAEKNEEADTDSLTVEEDGEIPDDETDAAEETKKPIVLVVRP
ncbi:MAG: hypothetical protein IJ083_03590 [Clostridia bacterium]|nr:hypothetical protein [Clostridia bacterium]